MATLLRVRYQSIHSCQAGVLLRITISFIAIKKKATTIYYYRAESSSSILILLLSNDDLHKHDTLESKYSL